MCAAHILSIQKCLKFYNKFLQNCIATPLGDWCIREKGADPKTKQIMAIIAYHHSSGALEHLFEVAPMNTIVCNMNIHTHTHRTNKKEREGWRHEKEEDSHIKYSVLARRWRWSKTKCMQHTTTAKKREKTIQKKTEPSI